MNLKITTLAVAALAAVMPVAASAASVDYPVGTQIFGTLQQELNTKNAYEDKRFTIVTDGGSVIRGHLSEVVKSSISHKAHMKLNFDSIKFPDGTRAPIDAKVSDVQQKTQYNIARAAGSVIVGDIVGNMVGHAVGVRGVGGLAGIAGGALYAQNTATDLQIPAGSHIGIQLTEPLVVRPQSSR